MEVDFLLLEAGRKPSSKGAVERDGAFSNGATSVRRTGRLAVQAQEEEEQMKRERSASSKRLIGTRQMVTALFS